MFKLYKVRLKTVRLSYLMYGLYGMMSMSMAVRKPSVPKMKWRAENKSGFSFGPHQMQEPSASTSQTDDKCTAKISITYQ